MDSQTGSEGSAAADKDLYVLVNGVANPLPGEPDYLTNLGAYLIKTTEGSSEPITQDDIVKAPIFIEDFKFLDKPLDALHWILEVQNPIMMLDLALEVLWDIQNHPGDESLRSIIGMGFSGGFAPLAKALEWGGYKVKTMVGLAPGILSLREIPSQVFDKLSEAVINIETGVREGLKEILEIIFTKIPILNRIPVLGNIASLIGEVLDLVGVSAEQALRKVGELLKKTYKLDILPGLPNLSSLEAIANVWGTKDVLVRLGLVGGYRDELLGLSAHDPVKTLFNIEIKGATHSNYMRRDDPAINNTQVNEFVTKLIERSKSKIELKTFLESDPRVQFNVSRNVYEVTP